MFKLICCKYLAKNTTKIPTSTQKTTIKPTLSNRNVTRIPSLSTKSTTPIPSNSFKTTNKNNVTVTTTTIPSTTTTIGDVTTDNPLLNKGPRIGDNNITESVPPIDDQTTTTTPMDGITTLLTTMKDGLITQTDATTTIDSIDKTTLPPSIGNVTKKPATRVDTTLEVESERPSTTTEIGIEMSTNPILIMSTTTDIPDGITDSDLTTVTYSVSKSVRRKCASQTDCPLHEMCINRECFKICQTNVTKSDDCVQGTCV